MTNLFKNSVSLALLLTSYNLLAQTGNAASEETAVLNTIDAFFEALANSDRSGLEATTIPRSVFVTSTTSEEGQISTSTRSTSNFIAALTDGDRELLERYWEPTVLVREGIAVFWAPYDFHIGGKFSHCGIDSFQLFKLDGQWRIGSSSYTVERANCAPSPLGPVN